MLYRKIFKILSFIILLLLGLLIIVILTINLPFARKHLVRIINRNLQQSEIPVHIGALNIVRPGQISISKILITGEQYDTILFAGNLDIHIAPRTLLQRKITLLSVNAHDLSIRLLQDEPEQPLNLIAAFSNEENTSKEQDDDSSKWTFDIRDIRLTSVDFQYHSKPQKMLANLRLKEAGVRINKMDLSGKEMIVSLIHLDEANGALLTDDNPPDNSDTTATFDFPWKIEIADIKIQNCSFKSGKYPESPVIMEAPQFIVSGFQADLSEITLKQDQQSIKIIQTQFHLNNGFELREFQGKLDSRKTETIFEFHILTNESELHLDGKSDTILFGITENNTTSSFSITDSRIAFPDFLYFNPELSNADWFNEYGKSTVSIEAKVFRTGNITRIDSLYLYQSQDLWLSLEGSISDLPDTLLPKDVDLKMNSSLGDITLDGSIDLAKERINATVLLNNVRPGDLTNQNVLQEINGSVVADVSGFSISKLFSEFKIRLHSVNINNHVYDKILLSGNVSPQRSSFSTSVIDTALTLALRNTVIRNENELSLHTNGDFTIIPAGLNLGTDSLKVDGMISGNFLQAGESLSATLELSEIELTKPGNGTRISGLQMKLESDSLSTRLLGDSDFMDMEFEMEGPLNNAGTLISGLSGYFGALVSNFFLDSAFQTFEIPIASFNARFSYHPLLNFLTSDTSLKFSNASIQVSSGEQTGQFLSYIQATGIHAGNLSVNNFHAELIDLAGDINMKTTADSISIASQTFLGIELSHESDCNSHQGQTALAVRKDENHMNSEILIESLLNDSFLIVTIPSMQILLNGTIWQTSAPELFRYNPGKGEFLPEITLFSDSAEMELVTIKENPETGFNVRFEKVDLSSLIPAGILPGGLAATINGSVRYRNTAPQHLSIDADLDLAEVAWSDLNIAQLGINGSYNSAGSDNYRFETDVSLDSASIHLEGISSSPQERNFEAQFSDLSLNMVKPFIEDAVSELTGTLSGDVRSTAGNTNELLEGNLNLNDVRVRVTSSNSLFRIPDDNITLARNKITFDRFMILDSLDNELLINGNIDISNRAAINADLDISSPNLLVMNSTQSDNESFYGTILVGTLMTVRGPVTSPKVQGDLSLNKGTEIYYANQISYQLQDMSETVTFINTGLQESSPKTVAEEVVAEQRSTIGATVEVDPETIIHFSLQDQLYDINLDIQGGGTLNYSVFSNNQANLSGIYEISDGNADLKIRGWSEKKFSIADGSFIRWIDKMEDPQLQIEAQSTVTGKYKNPTDRRDRIVDFNVVLKLTDRLSALDALFTVTTEDPYLMSIINSMSPEEQMKQAVTLLLFQTINIPGIYTTSNQITDQVNQIVESQLNKLTQTSIKNIDISLGVNSYTSPTESGSEETQTSLSYDIKKDILDDRASIEVSGRLNNSEGDDYSASNFTFEYRLDSAATKYIQVYRKRSYEDILEGEVERTGFGIIFRKTFDSIRDIWPGNRKRHNE
jgi:translocation and assembly module TamB